MAKTFNDDAIWTVVGEGMGTMHIQAPDAATAIHAYVAWCEDDGITDEIRSVTRVADGVVRLRPEE